MKKFTNPSNFDKQGSDAHFVSFFITAVFTKGWKQFLKKIFMKLNSHETVILLQPWFKTKDSLVKIVMINVTTFYSNIF